MMKTSKTRKNNKVTRTAHRGALSSVSSNNNCAASILSSRGHTSMRMHSNTIGKMSLRDKTCMARSLLSLSRATQIRTKKKIGNKVNKDQILGIISNPFGTEKTYVKAKKTGIIIGITMMPLVSNGDALFHVATFDNIRAVAEEVLYSEEELE